MSRYPDSRRRRMLVWRHNGMIGSARMMQAQANNICNSETATDESKGIAADIAYRAKLLAESLKTRVPFPKDDDNENGR